MTWAADITSYNTAVNALGAYIIAREANTPEKTLLALRTTAQAGLTDIATPLSATITFPKYYPAL